jgi:hypothetical protein
MSSYEAPPESKRGKSEVEPTISYVSGFRDSKGLTATGGVKE